MMVAARATRLAVAFVRLRWRLLRGAVRRGGTERVGAVLSTVASAIAGLGLGLFLLVGGRTVDEPDVLAIVACTTILLALLGFGIVAGVSQPIDPRVLGSEPLTPAERALGLLAASAFGPPGLAGITIGVGLVVGFTRSAGSLPIVALAVLSWLCSLLLVTRTATNLLGLVIARFPRTGQLTVGVVGLLVYGVFQFVPALLGGLEPAERRQLADVLRWSPPGQIGEAVAAADDAPLRALGHLTAGSIWIPLTAGAFVWSAERLGASVARGGDRPRVAASRPARLARRLCGDGPEAAIAWRSLLTRFRTPRTALETVTGAGVGLGAVLFPALARDGAGAGAVLVGGAVQLAVLFMSGNSFGVDGPAITHELLAGADARSLAAGKARSVAIVAAPLAVIGPLVAASVTGEWRFLVAGFGVGVGGLLAGTGAAIVQSALVPIAVPESDNPFAGGESGKGMIAALLLALVLTGLAVATVPVALALLWATDRGQVGLVTVFGAATVLVGWGLYRVGVVLAAHRLRHRDPEFVASVTPAR